MQEYLEEIEGWMKQVRDDSMDVEDYDFLDRLSHGGKDGNNGLANVGAYLAVYEEDGDLQVDKELVKELDSRQESGRKRFSNIVHEGKTEKREGNTLEDNRVNGHERLQTMLDEFRSNYEPRSRGDSHMTEENDENSYDEALRTLDTAGGYGLAFATGLINVPVTALGVAADHLEGDNNENQGTEIEVTEEQGLEEKPGNDTISSKPETESESHGGDNDMVTDDQLEQAEADRTEAVADVSDNLTEAGATVDDAANVASDAASAYLSAKGDLDDAREVLKDAYDQDSEMFGYVSEALEDINSTLEDEVVSVLSGLNHDSYDLEDVKREMDAAGHIWDKNLPDDPSDITSY